MLGVDTFIVLVKKKGALGDVGSAAYKDENEIVRASKKFVNGNRQKKCYGVFKFFFIKSSENFWGIMLGIKRI